MGESELFVRVCSPLGGEIYSAVDPDEALAFSEDGRYLYVQDKTRPGFVHTQVIDVLTGKRAKNGLPPVVGDKIVIVSDLPEDRRLPLGGVKAVAANLIEAVLAQGVDVSAIVWGAGEGDSRCPPTATSSDGRFGLRLVGREVRVVPV